MMENIRTNEILVPIVGLGLLAISFLAFSRKTRKEIGKRDCWTCVDCGREFKDGWMVHAAHESNHHLRSDPYYDNVSSGKIRCVECHQGQHERGTNLGSRGDSYAVGKLKKTDRRTRKWRSGK